MKLLRDIALISALLLVLSIEVHADNRVHNNDQNQNSAVKNQKSASKYEPDNTGINVRDRNDKNLTADDQSSSGNDTELAAKIRSSLMKADELSTLAQNVKVIVQRGVVTLRGPVNNSEEKRIIEQKAVQVAGLSNVRNEIEIKVN
jgi:hyperosmotically inducible protein